MKKLVIAALVAAQVASAAPAAAANFAEARQTEAGAFAGLRLRLALDPQTQDRRLRAGFAVAPTLHMRDSRGSAETRLGEGLELGVAPGERLRLSLGGRPVSQLTGGGDSPGGRRAGVSTLGWVGIGAGALLVVTLVAGFLVVDDIVDCDPDEECN